jgi:DNA-binding MarR family transcriptional regulator
MSDSSTVDVARLANRLGALALHVTDRVESVTAQAAGRAASAPAALNALTRERRRPIEYLRHVLGLSHPATVRLLDRLTDDQLVRRTPGPNRRTVVPELTAAGQHAAARVLTARAAVLRDMLAGLTPTETRQLQHLLDKLLAATATNDADAIRLCRLCDLHACESSGPCPVDAGLTTRSALHQRLPEHP